MSGIQISGLLTNSAFDWKSVVDQLITADSAPITRLTAQKSTNTDKVTALSGLRTSLQGLQDSLQAIRAGDLFSLRNVNSDTAGTTWKSNSASGATVGSYKFAVQQLATATIVQGAADVGAGLAATSDVSGLTLANLNTATAVTAGTFTVDGQTITIATTDSMQDVFDKIATATGDVTASYDPASDRITLSRPSGDVVLGAANDTSNFLGAMKLTNNGSGSVSSLASLGTLRQSSPLISAGLKGALTGVDGSGNGAFTINGVSISYNVNTDSLGSVISRINQAGAGVTASYDATTDRMKLTNTKTGDLGMGVTDVPGGLLDALGLTSPSSTLVRGNNALYTVNGGPTLTSSSNTFDASTHGISGLSVTVNTVATQTVSVESDLSSMTSAVQTFMDKFNAVQDAIDAATKTTVAGGAVTTSILSDNREVQSWASNLRSMAFDAVSGVSGTVQRLDNLGIDFDSTSGHLTLKNPDKLANALRDNPDDVKAFFLTPNTGLVSKGYGYLTNLISADSTQQENLNKTSRDIDKQIATLQARLDAERVQLTNSFILMLDAQSTAQSQNTTLTNAFFNKNTNG
ncbi:MAG: flagellar filament capping protein FliD [Opitutaceae bacterium]